MKETIIIFIFFLLAAIIVTAIGTTALVMYLIGSRLFLFPAVTPGLMAALVPGAMLQMLLPSTLIVLFLTLIRLRRKPRLLFVSYLLVGGLAFAALVMGPRLITTTVTEQMARIQGESALGLRDLAYPQKLIALRNGYLYFEQKNDARLSSVLLIDFAGAAPGLRVFDRALVRTAESGTVLVT
ncbi:MAG TPA: hypothetical protein ENN69_07230, partial [Spirochaetia bacterium]|nr:hypothetical protein [Spirochaetia bacterium]